MTKFLSIETLSGKRYVAIDQIICIEPYGGDEQCTITCTHGESFSVIGSMESTIGRIQALTE